VKPYRAQTVLSLSQKSRAFRLVGHTINLSKREAVHLDRIGTHQNNFILQC